jgi:hypothetical protein
MIFGNLKSKFTELQNCSLPHLFSLEKVKRTHIAATANIQETSPHVKKP